MGTWESIGHVPLKGQGRDPNTLRGKYLENGWRQRLGDNGAPVQEMGTWESNGHVTDDVA